MKKKTWHFKKWVEILLSVIMVLAVIGMVSVNPTLDGIITFIICGSIVYGCYKLLEKYGYYCWRE